VIINFLKRSNVKKGADGEKYSVDILLCVEAGSSKDRPVPAKRGAAAESLEWRVVPCSLQMLDGISAIKLFVPNDIRALEKRAVVGKSVNEVCRRFPDGPPLLDPFEDLKVEDKDLKKIMRKVEVLDDRISGHPLPKLCEEGGIDLTDLLEAYNQRMQVDKEIKAIKHMVKVGQGIILKDELKKYTRVLRRLGFIDEENIIGQKGRTACEINTADELVVTELIFNGSFNELTPEVTVALLSCFVFDERNDEDINLPEKLKSPFNTLTEIAKNVATITADCKLPVNVDEFVAKFQPNAMMVMYEWCMGKTFAQICTMTSMYEGSIIRCMRRLDELMRQLVAAAKSIGNAELEEKFKVGGSKLKRGVPFQASLYL